MQVDTSAIAANLANVRERIARAAQRAGRRADEVTLVAVSKTFPAESIRAAYAAGARHFGENRVQEWEKKSQELADLEAIWHLVGHLQSNKVSRAVRLFDAIDSVDSIELAQRVDRAVASLESENQRDTDGALKRAATQASQRAVPVLIEVHLGSEETKSGVAEAEVPRLAEVVLGLPHLELRGLMCIPPYFDNPEHARPYFRKLCELRDSLRQQLAGSHNAERFQAQGRRGKEPLLHELSMGMTHDFEVAIEEGATQIRLGTAIFGTRPAE